MICEESRCTGCGCCAGVCPVQCIAIKENEFGELYPVVDEGRCVSCGLCQQSCPANNRPEYRAPRLCFAAWSKDAHQRNTSASGGLAAAFSAEILEKGGAVFGVRYGENLTPIHACAKTAEEANEFKGSKYVQSSAGVCFDRVRSECESGAPVLFVGTPCQVDGLNHFLRKSYDNLITVDLICHGTPPAALLRAHLRGRLGERAGEVTAVSFRGEDGYRLKAWSEHGILYERPSAEDPYFLGFMQGLYHRECCYQCVYARPERVADVTIGDFWGLGKETPFPHDTEKVSVALVNTEKGEAFFESCRGRLEAVPREIGEAVAGDAQLRAPSKGSEGRQAFRENFLQAGFEKAFRRSPIFGEWKKMRRLARVSRLAARMPDGLKRTLKRAWKRG